MDLLGSAEVAELVGLKPETIWVYTSRGMLPEPDLETARQKLWYKDTIVEWATVKGVGKFRRTDGTDDTAGTR